MATDSVSWKFEQLAGPRRRLELTDWNAPHGRSRQAAVVRPAVSVRAVRTRYPGSTAVTRHVFGLSFGDFELKGRLRRGQVQAKMQEIRAFVSDAQPVRITWGAMVVCEGFVMEFDPGIEGAGTNGATEVEWMMRIEVDTYPDLQKRTTVKNPRKPTDYTSAIKASLLKVQTDLGELSFAGSIGDLITNALDQLVGAVAGLTSFTDGLTDWKNSALATVNRVRGAAQTVIRAGQELREFIESVPIEARQVGARFQELNAMTTTPGTLEQIQGMMKEGRDLDEAADRAIIGRTRTTYVAKPGDTWESIAQQFGVGASKLRDANLASPGEPVRVGQEYLIPE